MAYLAYNGFLGWGTFYAYQIYSSSRNREGLFFVGFGHKRDPTAQHIEYGDRLARSPGDYNIIVLGGNRNGGRVDVVNAQKVGEESSIGGIVGDGDHAAGVGFAVAPAIESDRGEGVSCKSDFTTIIVFTGTIYGTQIGVVGLGGNSELFMIENSSVGKIAKDGDYTGIVGIAVGPLFEYVVLERRGADYNVLAAVVSARAAGRTHGGVVAGNGDGVLFEGGETCINHTVGSEHQTTGIGGDSIAPLLEVAMFGWLGLESDKCAVSIAAARCDLSKSRVVAIDRKRELTGFEKRCKDSVGLDMEHTRILGVAIIPA